MTPSERHEIEKQMRMLDDHALLRLLAVESSDYRPEALTIASKELRLRNLNALSAEQYWKQFPLEKIGSDGFCANCRNQTTDESPGDTTITNFIFGKRLIGHDDRCFVCGSLLQTKWFQFILPIIPLGKYRVIYLEKGLFTDRYVGRRLRKKT